MINRSRLRFRCAQSVAVQSMEGDVEQALTWSIEKVSQEINKAFRQALYIDAKEVVGYEQAECTNNNWYDELFHVVLLGLDYSGKFSFFQSHIDV